MVSLIYISFKIRFLLKFIALIILFIKSLIKEPQALRVYKSQNNQIKFTLQIIQKISLMISEAPILNSKIIVVKDKYPRIYKLNEVSLSPKQSTKQIIKSSSQDLLQSQFVAYTKRKSDFQKNKQKNYLNPHLNQSQNQSYIYTPKISSQQIPLPLLNIQNKLKRYEEDSISSSQIASNVLQHFKLQKKRNSNNISIEDQIFLPRIYNLKDIKKNGQELLSLQQIDNSLLNKKTIFGFQDQSFQDSYCHNITTLQDEQDVEKSMSDKITSTKKDSSRSLINYNNNSNFYFSSNSNSFKNQNNSIMSQLKKDSLVLANYKQQKSMRAKNIAEIDQQLTQLKKYKIHS
ncbi:hypothetical protein TTHERM_000138409 (macronuclear) [Tetrahymena thermophila SB210]|uniref:Uncharacterized protein n=1 Tax=Tetrahymena thermophila (strain SB210) TaxID=312017 RepID=W7XAN6_TETTS|nr:hypothetical protein TTHERM_000138409 [Tetrahymena thermophila SB210]EWS73473.1 hypothetical protein TTHERM_000138409 [Tetrahymena thermophila SB210]|eukprot:XP_012653955.1 hypothetical protein TTHERM_000138409 [Tetrahymena thermophila SB210]